MTREAMGSDGHGKAEEKNDDESARQRILAF
jgi:hypothetical protein